MFHEGIVVVLIKGLLVSGTRILFKFLAIQVCSKSTLELASSCLINDSSNSRHICPAPVTMMIIHQDWEKKHTFHQVRGDLHHSAKDSISDHFSFIRHMLYIKKRNDSNSLWFFLKFISNKAYALVKTSSRVQSLQTALGLQQLISATQKLISIQFSLRERYSSKLIKRFKQALPKDGQ